MNFRAIRIVCYLIRFFLSSIPRRRQLAKLAKTDPKLAYTLAVQEVQTATGRMCEICGIQVEVTGLENIPEEACLFVGNHCSYFDIVTTMNIIPSGAGYVAKDSLGKIPGLASWMRLIHCLFLDRSDIRQGLSIIMEGVEYLKSGYSMFIFPEGTRHEEGDMGEFKGGSLKMAQRARAPIVPVAISGTRAVFEDNKGLRIKPSTVRISFGKPFKITDLPKEERKFAAERTRDCVAALLEAQKEA